MAAISSRAVVVLCLLGFVVPPGFSQVSETMFEFSVNWSPGSSTDTYQVDDLIRFLEGTAIVPVVSEDAVVVSEDVELIGSSTDELIFNVPMGATPGFQVGDIIVGDVDEPFLARVAGMTSDGSAVTVQTATASLAEAVRQGYLRTSLVFVPGATKGLSLPQDKDTETWEITPLTWEGTEVIGDSGVSATISGEAWIAPQIEVEVLLDDGIEYFRTEIIGDLGIDLDIDLQANYQYDEDPWEWEVNRWDHVFIQFIYGWPIWEHVTLRLIAGVDLDCNASARFETTAWAETEIHLGGDYDRDRPEGDRWELINRRSRDYGYTQPIISADGTVIGRFYVRPEVEMKIYSSVGPYFDIEPYVEFEGNATLLPQPSCEWWLRTGVDAELAFEISILDWDLARWDKQFNLWSKQLDSGTCSPPGTTSLQMVTIPAGSFLMGNTGSVRDAEYASSSEYPRHQVTFNYSFQMGKYEVTNAQYAEVLNWAKGRGYLSGYSGGDVYYRSKKLLTASSLRSDIAYVDGQFGSRTRNSELMDNHPVKGVSVYGAIAFCNWASERDDLPVCYNLNNWSLMDPHDGGYRLPSESEWEYACRGSSSNPNRYAPFSFGDDPSVELDWSCNYSSLFDQYMVWCGNTPSSSNGGWTRSVGSKLPNDYGLHDMHGNVWEWCEDWWHEDYTEAPLDGTAWSTPVPSNLYRMRRGGRWEYLPEDCRSADRGAGPATDTWEDIGFRVSRTP